MKTINYWTKCLIWYVKEEPVAAALHFTTGFVIGLILLNLTEKE